MTQSRFAKLIDLARTPDSNQRRELLREVTDLFFATSDSRTGRESALFDDVLQLVAAEMQDEVLAELAERFANADDAPMGLMRDLANHSFEISGPVLRHSKVLDKQTLLHVVNYQSQNHIKAVAQRNDVSETISDAIVRFGDDNAPQGDHGDIGCPPSDIDDHVPPGFGHFQVCPDSSSHCFLN